MSCGLKNYTRHLGDVASKFQRKHPQQKFSSNHNIPFTRILQLEKKDYSLIDSTEQSKNDVTKGE